MTLAKVRPSLRRALTVPNRPPLDDLREALQVLDAQSKETRGENDYDTILRAAALVRVAVAKFEKAGPPTVMLATPEEYLPDPGERSPND